MSTAPQLPKEISSDGREVFDWADRMSDHVQKLQRRRDVWGAILEGTTTCGSCVKWMTDACPREVQDNRRGHKVGPSCKAVKCNEFAMSSYDEKRIQGLRDEYATLSTGGAA
jgi:hypothetical protein